MDVRRPLSLPRALLYGHLLITLPILAGFVLVLLVPFLFVQVWEGQPSWFVLAWLGLLLVWTLAGWIWWALTLPRWRLWALRRVEDPRALRRWAVVTGLEWPRDHWLGALMAKTEIKGKAHALEETEIELLALLRELVREDRTRPPGVRSAAAWLRNRIEGGASLEEVGTAALPFFLVVEEALRDHPPRRGGIFPSEDDPHLLREALQRTNEYLRLRQALAR